MLLVFGTTMINATEVHSVMIKTLTDTCKTYPEQRWYNPKTWFLKPVIVNNERYRINIEYTSTDGKNYTFWSEFTNYVDAQNTTKEILKQMKMQTDVANQELVDKLFENAVKEAQ